MSEEVKEPVRELVEEVYYGPRGGEAGITWINRVQKKAAEVLGKERLLSATEGR